MPNAMLTDVLSDIFDQVEVQSMVTGGFAVRGPWASRGAVSRPLKLIALVAGSARITTDGPGGPEGPVDVEPGDVVLLNHRTQLDVRGGHGHGPEAELIPETEFDQMALNEADLATDDVLVGGWIRVNAVGLELLGTALPGLVHVRAADPAAPRLGDLVQRLFEEASTARLGSAFAMRQQSQLLLLEVLRTHLDHKQLPAGWLRLVTDQQLAPAVRLMHGQPDRSWGLVELSRSVDMSRTSFAERFRVVAGTTPLAYLSRWRMLLARRALRDPNARVGTIAAELGYSSDSSFSNAFKREVGVSPLHYRRLQASV